jgi:hypothetical protein
MPVFSFEKISVPVASDAVSPIASIVPVARKPRGAIVQIMDRFVAARLRLTLSQPAGAENEQAESQG